MSQAVSAKPDVVVRPIVLVVDDDPAVLDALSSLLQPRLEPLYVIETAESAEVALELVGSTPETAAERPVALVISDEKMPGRSGTDLLIDLRQHAAHRHGGRIVITAYAGLASAKKAINEAEVDRYYPKPWDAEGALIPAIAEILTRFARQRGLDRFLLASAVQGADDRQAVHEARRGWWEYLTLLDGDAEEEGIDVPAFDEPEDEGATLFLARRNASDADRPAGTIRLRKLGEDWLLDGLAFMPEEAGDEVETLLLRTAIVHAADEGIETVRTEAPLLRREVYEALGFEPSQGDGQDESGTVSMSIRIGRAVGADEFIKRYAEEHRLCACTQTGCPDRDYTADRRGYFCPLDIKEGRVPEGFPSA